jgi:hypothetical protein
MQIMKISLDGVTAVLTGPNWEPGVWLNGKCICPEVSDPIFVPPGEPFEIDLKEARRLLRQHGGTILTEPPPPELVEAIKAHDDELARGSPPYIPSPDDPPSSEPGLGVRHGSRSQLQLRGPVFEVHHGRLGG